MSGSGLQHAGRAHEQEARVLTSASQGEGAGLHTTRKEKEPDSMDAVGYKASMYWVCKTEPRAM
jgi:hypothetical protein